jgi:putative phosphoribosyl transferase
MTFLTRTTLCASTGAGVEQVEQGLAVCADRERKAMSKTKMKPDTVRNVLISSNGARLEGELMIPKDPIGIVLFANGSSRHRPLNKSAAQSLHESRIGTLLFDLLTAEEEDEEQYTRHLRFNISLLALRLADATLWVKAREEFRGLPIGFFGASTGAAAALVAAAELQEIVAVVVSRGGRADLAEAALAKVKAPTLLIVGGLDEPVVRLNRDAYARLDCEKQVEIVAGASHLFAEPGALEATEKLATEWLVNHFQAR